MSKASDFFQCLVCNSFFGSLWKVETHVKGHNEEEKRIREGTDNGPRRRGMLPIRKRTFYECYVPVVKNQIDPDFLAGYESVQSNDEKVGGKSARRNRELRRLGVSEELMGEYILNSSVKRPRRGNLQASIRKAAAILTVPDPGEEEDDDSDKDYIESLLEKDSQDDDGKDDSSDYEAYFCKKGRKRGRPLGSCTLPKDRKQKKVDTTSSKTNYLRMSRKWIWDGKDHSFKCEYCPQSFPKRVMISYHIVSEHKDVAKTIDCPISICDKTCVTYLSLRDHVRNHELAEQKEVLVKEELLSLNSDTDKKPDKNFFRRYGGLSCQYCLVNIGFSLEHLEKHKETEHGENVVLKCPFCEKCFHDSVLELIGHVKSFHTSCLDPYNERFRRKAEEKELEPRFNCDKCGFQSRFDYQLKKHKESHENMEKEEVKEEKPFKCPSCNKGFKYKDNLRRHFMLHLENNPFVCDFPNCNRKFNSHYNLRRHKLLHSQTCVEANRVYCPICNQGLSQKDKLIRHMKTVHKPEDLVNGLPVASSLRFRRNRIRMPHVGFEKYSKKDLQSAQTTATNNNAESDCFPSSVSPSEVQEENSLIKSEDSEEIHLIDKILVEENGMAIHIKGEHLSPQKTTEKESTSKGKPSRLNSSRCITANENFSIPAVKPLDITKLITNDPIFKNFDPKKCAEVKGFLARNHKYITGSKTFTCIECNAVFSRAWTLQLHLKSIHNKTLIDESSAIISQNNAGEIADSADGERNQVTLMCGTCAYVAKDSKDLQTHMKSSHKNIRTHRCHICGRNLKNNKRLQMHINEVHMGPRNHFCKYCKKSFATRSIRLTHEKKSHENPSVNEGKKQCPICHKYYSPRSVDAHIKRHKPKNSKELEKLRCQLCQDVFSCSTALKRHIDCVHLGKPFNIIANKKYAAKRYPWLKPRAPEKQAQKTSADDEWYKPLLDKVEGAPTRKLKPTESIPEEEASEENALSILGF